MSKPVFNPLTSKFDLVSTSADIDHNSTQNLTVGDPHTQYLQKTQYAEINRQGFLNLTETTIAFDGTNLFTLGSVGSSWSYYRSGIKYTVTGSKTVTLAGTPVTTGHYYIYIDATNGILTASTTVWTLLDSKVPVASIYFDNTLTPKYWMADERHTILIDQKMQYYLHMVEGAKLVSYPTLTGPVLNSGNDADKCIGMTASSLVDQDIKHEIPLVTKPDGTTNTYSVWYRTSPTTWGWKLSTVPFIYNVGNTNNIIQYDNAGTMTDGTIGTGTSRRWVNSYLLVTNISGVASYTIVPGRAQFTSLALAQAESVSAFDWTGFPISECVIAYRLTWLPVSLANTGQCHAVATPQLLNLATVTNASSGAGVDHNTLTNLQGGTTNEYYHLTLAELNSLAASGSFNRIFSKNVTLTNGSSIVTYGYVSIGDYSLTMEGDSVLYVI